MRRSVDGVVPPSALAADQSGAEKLVGDAARAREVVDDQLEVDDVLRREAGHGRRPDVIGPDQPGAGDGTRPGERPASRHGPLGVGRHDDRVLRSFGRAASAQVCLERHQALVPRHVDGAQQFVTLAGVVEPDVGRGTARVVVGLRPDPRPCVVGIHPTVSYEATYPVLRRCMDDENEVIAGTQVVLDQQRHVLDDDGVGWRLRDQLSPALTHQRVHDRVQSLPARFVPEDDPAKSRAVQ